MQHPRTEVDDDPDATRRVAAHREGVVRRLLHAGLSVRLLRALLPEWCALIERVSTAGAHRVECPADLSV